MYLLYSILLSIALLLSAPWWLWEMLRHGKYQTGLRERLGQPPDRLFNHVAVDTIWIHAVSVGEVLAVSRVVEQLKSRLPDWRVVISTTTDTGQQLARERFGEDHVFYFPLDFPFAVKAYLRALRPQLLVLAESEFWPNLLHEAKRSGAAVAVINARISDRSLPRYMRFQKPLKNVLSNVDVFLAQSGEDARRLVLIGAPAERVHAAGNLKFEVMPPTASPIVAQLKLLIARDEVGPVLLAGSTLDGEEAMLLQCFREVVARYPGAALLLAPRHPQRFATVATLLASAGVCYQRRSEWDTERPLAGSVFLLDSIGELAGLYDLADLAFIGGSLVPRGGHNILEAAQFGVPVLVGPHTQNFRDIITAFQAANAVTVITPESLTLTVLKLLNDFELRVELGKRAVATMRQHQGATDRTVNSLLDLLPNRPASYDPADPALASERQA